jgi:hypothetical protein
MVILRPTIFILLCTLTVCQCAAQQHRGEIWGGYISSVKISDHFAVWNDFHFVPNSFFASRHGLTWAVNNNFDLTSGYAFVTTSTAFSNKLNRLEHRPWGQVVARFNVSGKFSYRTRFRYDARFRKTIFDNVVTDEYGFNHRLRFFNNLRYTFKTTETGSKFHFDVMNELLFNIGKNISNGIDQIRVFAMFGSTQKSLTIMAGYHFRYFPSLTEGRYRHGFTVWIIHNMHRKCTTAGCTAD